MKHTPKVIQPMKPLVLLLHILTWHAKVTSEKDYILPMQFREKAMTNETYAKAFMFHVHVSEHLRI